MYSGKSQELALIQSEKIQILKEISLESDETPQELFEIWFDSDIMNLILEETLKYVMQNNNYTFLLSEKLLELFI